MALIPVKKSFMMKCIEEVYTVRMGHKMYIEDILKVLYINENKSVRVMSKELNISPMAVSKWLKFFGINTRKITWL